MNKGVTPHNYNLRNRLIPELLRPSDFTPPSLTSTSRPTAPPHFEEPSTFPTTSLLLNTTASMYTSPVTIYPPLSTLQTTLTNATSILTTPSPAPVILPPLDLDSTALTPSLPAATPRKPDSDFTSTFGRVTPNSAFQPNCVPELTKTLPVLDYEHLSRIHIHSGDNKSAQKGDIANVMVMDHSQTLEIMISTSQHKISLRLVRQPWNEKSLSPIFFYEKGKLNMAESVLNMSMGFYGDSNNGASVLIRRRNKKDYELYGVYFVGSRGHIIQPVTQHGIEMLQLKLHQPVSHLVTPVSHSGLQEVEDISHMRATILLGKTRHKRALVQHTIELLMVVDYAAFEWWTSLAHETVTQSTEADVMRMIYQYYAYTYNGLDLRMQSILDKTVQIKLAFVGLIVAKTPEDSYWTTGPSVSSSGGSTRRMLNASMALDNFQIWLDQNAVDLPTYDHAMLFTGYNLTYGGSAGNTGLAFKGSICRNVSNSSVVEDVYDTRTAIYAAQQLSRSLGARDDMDGNKCFSFSNYIMTPKIRLPLDRSVSSLSSFSPCSLFYFRQYIEKLNSEGINCMLSTTVRPWGNHLTNRLSEVFTDLSPFPGVLVDSAQFHDLTTQLPGMAYTGDQQCINSFGAGSYVCRGEITGDYHKICQGLLCHVPLTGFCDYILPADGTPCGNMSICMKGKCVMLQSANDKLLDNCPFGDQPSSDCHLLIRSRPYSCYNNTVKFSCCASCTEIRESFLPGCEYGNRIDTCSMKDCNTGDKNYRDFLCCWTCVNGPTPYSPPSMQYETGISPTVFDISDNSNVVSCYEQVEQGNTTSPNVAPNIETLPDVSIDEMSKISPGSSPGTLAGSSPGILTGSSPGTLAGSSPEILAGSSPEILTGSSPGILTGSSPGTLSRTFMVLTGFSLDTSSQKSLNLVSDNDLMDLPIMINEITSRGSVGDVDTIFPSSNTVTAATTSTGFYNEESFSRSNIFLSSATSIVISTTESNVQTVAYPIVKDLPLIVTRQIWGGLRPDGTPTGTSAFVSPENHILHPTISLSNGATFFRSGDSLATTTITMPTTLNSINEPDSSNRVLSSHSSTKVSSSMVNSQGQESDLVGETSTLRLLPSEETGSLMSILHTGAYIQSDKVDTPVRKSDKVDTPVGKSETLPTKSITTELHIENPSHRGSALTRMPGQSTVHLKMNPALYPNPLSTDSNLASTTKHAMDRGNKVNTGNDLLVTSSNKQLGNRSKATNGPKVSSNQRGNRGPGNDRSQGLQDKMLKCVVSDEQNSASIENQSIECEHDDGEPVIDRESVYNKLFPRKSQRHQHDESKHHQIHSLRWILQTLARDAARQN